MPEHPGIGALGDRIGEHAPAGARLIGGPPAPRQRLPPGQQRLAQALDDRRMLRGQVVRFSRVLLQVVKLRVAAIPPQQQLPVSLAHGQVGPGFAVASGPVRRPVPEQGFGPLGGRLAQQGAAQVLAIEGQLRPARRPCQACYGGEQVHGGNHGGFVDRPAGRFGHQARPPHDKRLPDAAFIQHSLVPAERPRRPGAGLRAVVAGHQNHGVGAQARLLADVIEQRRQLLVHRLDHPEVKLLACCHPPAAPWAGRTASGHHRATH